MRRGDGQERVAPGDANPDWLLWYNRTRLHSTLHYVSPGRARTAVDDGGADESRRGKMESKNRLHLSYSHDDEVTSVMRGFQGRDQIAITQLAKPKVVTP